MKETVLNAPDDTLAGIGAANIGYNPSVSGNTAEARAREELIRQLLSIAQGIGYNYMISGEVDPMTALSFQEKLSIAASKVDVNRAKLVERKEDQNGNIWAVVYMTKADIAAMLAVPEIASSDFNNLLDAALAKVKREEAKSGW